MFNICVCDDEECFLNDLCIKLEKMAVKNNIEINIHKYHSSDQVLFDIESLSEKIDCFFLDVLIDDRTGVEIANHLRRKGSNAPVVFLTVSKEHVFDALEIMPLHYLIKQEVQDEKIEEILLKATQIVGKYKAAKFFYKVGHELRSIDIEKVMYFEVLKRIVIIHTLNGEAGRFYSTLEMVEKQLDHKQFVRIHRSYLCNLFYIDKIQSKQVIFRGRTSLPVGSKYMKDLKVEYTQYMLRNL